MVLCRAFSSYPLARRPPLARLLSLGVMNRANRFATFQYAEMPDTFVDYNIQGIYIRFQYTGVLKYTTFA